ncbi:PKD repeat protein [Spirosoma oryzae]|uniref:PKD repeat protein n=1 Tax=Spirosoma oryzae TaxID=1469603 RepID=A0A2T0TMQ0_9BACT|nr:LamG-like jellyroll fold domain-containing protein [Spirosoma oryzae]PRY46992.1 PKD repeat protein [Spirosoma oryzae]
MNRFYSSLYAGLSLLLLGTLLWACEPWDLPGRKVKRNCEKPSGTIEASIQQRQVSFSIGSSSGTIDNVSWDFGNGSSTVTTGLTAMQTYATSGTYTVRATLANSCGSSSETTIIRSLTVSDAVAPSVSLQDPTTVSLNSATLPVTITSTGNATITQYGICYSTTNTQPEPGKDATVQGPLSASVNVAVPLSATALSSNTLYYVRAFAINSAIKTAFSDVKMVRTGANPVVSINTNAATAAITSATVGFVLASPGSPAAVEYGICYSSTTNAPDVTNAQTVQVSNPSIGANTTVNLTNLTPNTMYNYRAYVKSSSGIIYSDVSSFKTQIDTVAQDLIASVSFTDQSLLDASGNNNNAILVNNPTFTADRKGRANSAIMLNGTGSYFYMAENSTLRPTTLSISIWIKPTTVDRRMQIYNKSRFSDGSAEMYSSLIKPSETIAGNITINTDIKQNSNCQPGVGWQTFPIDSKLAVNTWHHVVLTYSGRSARMYYDGALLATTDDLPASSLDQCPGGDLKFGAQSQQIPSYFYGALDDIRIYKRAITQDEVKTLYNQ